jgi:hypothetical protein
MLEDLGQNESPQYLEEPVRDETPREACCYRVLAADEEDYIYDNGEHGLRKLLRTENLARYRLIYKRFAHLRLEKLRNLHKVITLKRPVLVPVDREIYRVCKLIKLRNRTNKALLLWKEAILALVLVDIAGPFLPMIRGNKYFIQIVDNATRKT